MQRYLKLHPAYEPDWADPPFYQWNGSDQFRIFGTDYDYLSWAIVLLGLAFSVIELWQQQREDGFWRERRLLVELYLISFCTVIFVPEDFCAHNRAEAGLVVWRLV